jgi:hypothetical protein
VERKTQKPEAGNPTNDARGRPALESTSDFSSGVGRWVERNPIVSAVAFFGVGLIAGMLVGASVARE